MTLVVNANTLSWTVQRHLGNNTEGLGKSLEKLSSGSRLTHAAEDACGVQLSEELTTQVRGVQQALNNVQDGISLLNIADGVYQSVSNCLQRMRELSVEKANGTNSPEQQTALQGEIWYTALEWVRTVQAAQFNGVTLFFGSFFGVTGPPADIQIQAGPNNQATDIIDLSPALDQNMALADFAPFPSDPNELLIQIDDAFGDLNAVRGRLAGIYNRLEFAANNLAGSLENLSAGRSKVRDVDIASESAELVRSQILQQSSAALLAQANQQPSQALKLMESWE